jgi:restriction endonuclease-like protein
MTTAELRRLRRIGVIRPVVRGVYVDCGAEDSLPLRAAAIAKVAPADAVVCRSTAAWLYGVDVLAMQDVIELPKVDVVRARSVRALKSAGASGHSQTLLAGDVIDWLGLRVTSPLATAVHLARHLTRPFALSALDAMARAELVTPVAVRDAVRDYPHHPGIRQARELAGLIEPAAESPGESWLRLRMIDAGFPRPVPQVVIRDGLREYRVDLAFLDPLPGRGARRLALEYDSDQWHSTAEQLAADASRRGRLDRVGWEVLPVRRWQVWGADPALEKAVGELLGIRPRLPRAW